VAAFNTLLDDRVTWMVGAFKDTDDQGQRLVEGDWSFTGRLTGLPWYEEKGRELVHLGFGYSYRVPNDETYQVKAKPENSIASNFVDTGAIGDAERVMLFDPEVALRYSSINLNDDKDVQIFATRVQFDF
jgi:phosphate-selective porin OprO/OprP